MNKQRVMVTGGSGFVGSAVVKRLMEQSDRYDVVAVGRSGTFTETDGFRFVSGLELNKADGWVAALQGVDVVVHCAARAHVMNDRSVDPLAEFRHVNVDGALGLARQAFEAGVRRFLFVSSVKVHGEHTNNRAPFREVDELSPQDAYAISKLEAECKLRDYCSEVGMELVVIRPPLVYGPGVKGNFQSLLRLCNLPVPLPFGSMKNKRSLVYVGNLADFIVQCVASPKTRDEEFLVSDDEALSLSELLAEIRRAEKRSPLSVSVPVLFFRVVGTLLGKTEAVDRLTGALVIDSSKARTVLNWSPPYSVREGLQATVDDYNRRKRSGELV